MSIKKTGFDFNYRKQFENILNFFDIPREKTCLTGSMPLKYFGIRDNNDVDFLTLPGLRRKIHRKIWLSPKLRFNYGLGWDGSANFRNGIELSRRNRYGFMGISDEDLINNPKYHYQVNGYKIIKIELEMVKKHSGMRKKDKKDLEAIEKSGIIGSENWNWELFQPLPPWERPCPGLLKRVINYFKNEGLSETLLRAKNRLFPPPGKIKELKNNPKNIPATGKNKINNPRNGFYFYGIIWPAALPLADEIEAYLKNDFNVLTSTEFVLDEKFKQFVHSLYEVDKSTKEWLINKKLQLMAAQENRFRLLILDNIKNKNPEEVKIFKNKCRKHFQKRMDSYVFDNMLHMTENVQQNKHVYSVVKDYLNTELENKNEKLCN